MMGFLPRHEQDLVFQHGAWPAWWGRREESITQSTCWATVLFLILGLGNQCPVVMCHEKRFSLSTVALLLIHWKILEDQKKIQPADGIIICVLLSWICGKPLEARADSLWGWNQQVLTECLQNEFKEDKCRAPRSANKHLGQYRDSQDEKAVSCLPRVWTRVSKLASTIRNCLQRCQKTPRRDPCRHGPRQTQLCVVREKPTLCTWIRAQHINTGIRPQCRLVSERCCGSLRHFQRLDYGQEMSNSSVKEAKLNILCITWAPLTVGGHLWVPGILQYLIQLGNSQTTLTTKSPGDRRKKEKTLES